MRLGVHIGIGGGLLKAVSHAAEIGCECIQFFSSNPNAWKVNETDPAAAEAFRAATAEHNIHPITLHAPYLLNLASSKPRIWHPSWKNLAAALKRADMLGASYVVTHIGSHGGDGYEAGADRIRDAVLRALDESPGESMVLLEGGSGSGNSVGAFFEEQAGLLDRLEDVRERVGICLDTAHLYGAGYDISSEANANSVLAEFDRIVGFDRLHFIHLNDTRKDLGSRADRHWHIGKGNIGLEGFQTIVNHPGLADIAGIIETPEMELGMDKENLGALLDMRR